jgi:hypothetical protein
MYEGNLSLQVFFSLVNLGYWMIAGFLKESVQWVLNYVH